MKAEDIVKRLIDEKMINGEEAIVLMKEINKEPKVITTNIPYPIITNDNYWDNGIRYSNPTCNPSTIKYTTTANNIIL